MSSTEGKLCISQVNGKNTLSECVFSYPLRLSQQEKWLKHVSIIACGFGGGYVEGDSVSTSIDIEESAHACYRCLGMTKVFKSIANKASYESFKISLKANSFLVFIPEPVMCFANARFHQSYSVQMDKESSLVLVDWTACGRMGKENEFWSMQQMKKTIEVYRNGSLQFTERQDLRKSFDKGFAISDRVGRCGIMGSVLLIGKQTKGVRSRLVALQHRQSFREVRQEFSSSGSNTNYNGNNSNHNGGGGGSSSLISAGSESGLVLRGLLSSVSTIDDEFSLVRFTADSVDQGYLFLNELLRPIEKELEGLVPYADKLYGTSSASNNESSDGGGSSAIGPVLQLRKFDASDRISMQIQDELIDQLSKLFGVFHLIQGVDPTQR